MEPRFTVPYFLFANLFPPMNPRLTRQIIATTAISISRSIAARATFHRLREAVQSAQRAYVGNATKLLRHTSTGSLGATRGPADSHSLGLAWCF